MSEKSNFGEIENSKIVDPLKAMKKEILSRINAKIMSPISGCCFRNLKRFDLRRFSSLAGSAPSLASNDDETGSSSNSRSRTDTEQAAPPTVKNVVAPVGLMQDTLDSLYGNNATHGIADWRRFELLNQYLRGFRLGELTILTGPTGSGKTTFLSEYSLDLAEQGVKTLWCNFELKNANLLAMMFRQYYSRQTPFDTNITTPDSAQAMIEDMQKKLPMLFTTFTGATSADTVMKTILAQHKLDPLQHVIVDNLQFMLGTAVSANPFMMQDAVYSKFRSLASTENIHVTMVLHPRKFSQTEVNCDQELSVHSLYGGGKASQEADNILLIQTRRYNGEYFTKYLQIAKNRYFGDIYTGNRMELTFHKASRRHLLSWRKDELKPNNGGFKKRF